jgi:hypothetical protein
MRLLKRKLKKAATLYGFKYHRQVNRGRKMTGLDTDLVAESAAKYGVTAIQLEDYLLTGVVE